MTLKNQLKGARSNRLGKVFESLLDAACGEYAKCGIAYIEKTPEPVHILGRGTRPGTFLCNFAKYAQPDYKGTLRGGQAICFEAKATASDRMDESRVSPEQTAALQKHYGLGADVFVMVNFRLENTYRIPWEVWTTMKERFGRRYITERDIEEYKMGWNPKGYPMILDGITIKIERGKERL